MDKTIPTFLQDVRTGKIIISPSAQTHKKLTIRTDTTRLCGVMGKKKDEPCNFLPSICMKACKISCIVEDESC